ncbi:Clp protease N-terminal domain-containing protein [Tsukamurella soli]|uniref:Clp protease N-terminal domain-containing protein n=1 Tax=Tsukamurella soli TaxID=644556 RepID=A0ABP8JWL5_9ACTN
MFERFTREARAAVVLAQEEARDQGADRITATHLLLGVLTGPPADAQRLLEGTGVTVDGVRAGAGDRVLTDTDAEALRGIGIDLDAVAAAVARRFGADIRRPVRKRFRAGHIPFDTGAKKSLEVAVRNAVAHGDRSIRAEHVLFGIASCDDASVYATIETMVPLADLRSRVEALLRPAA